MVSIVHFQWFISPVLSNLWIFVKKTGFKLHLAGGAKKIIAPQIKVMETVRKSITFTNQQDSWIKLRVQSGDFTNDS